MVGQGLAGNFQFSQSALVIEVSVIKMLCSCKVCFPGVWTNAKCLLNGCFCQGQPRRSMVVGKEVNLVMTQSERAIGLEKRWIARHSLVQQIDCLLLIGVGRREIMVLN